MTGPKRNSVPVVAEMSDLQLLAHLLNMAGLDVTKSRGLAHGLLNAHGTLRQVLELPAEDMLGITELGENAAAFLLLLPALVTRYTGRGQGAYAPTVRLWTIEDAATFVLPHFRDRHVEQVCVFCLGEDLSLRTAAQVARGGAMEVTCSIPRILRLAIVHGAASVVLAHNHPDGSPVFSKNDLVATAVVDQALSSAGKLLGDHLLLAGERVISLREQCRRGLYQDTLSTHLPSWARKTAT